MLQFNDAAGVKKIVFRDKLANAEGRKKDSKTVVNSHVGLFACNYFFSTLSRQLELNLKRRNFVIVKFSCMLDNNTLHFLQKIPKVFKQNSRSSRPRTKIQHTYIYESNLLSLLNS